MTHDPLRCQSCGRPVGRTSGGFPRTFCSAACNRKARSVMIASELLARIRDESIVEPKIYDAKGRR